MFCPPEPPSNVPDSVPPCSTVSVLAPPRPPVRFCTPENVRSAPPPLASPAPVPFSVQFVAPELSKTTVFVPPPPTNAIGDKEEPAAPATTVTLLSPPPSMTRPVAGTSPDAEPNVSGPTVSELPELSCNVNATPGSAAIVVFVPPASTTRLPEPSVACVRSMATPVEKGLGG